ncbi:unnamed protein product [Lactuca saligna]|uniref:Protein kinase domain-containing protein n=1 Tax=Lactuca saligna TaxID=75948 RepID=A0AA35V953_LACSI|nr:unnamed protein product [Lactuca saligna]
MSSSGIKLENYLIPLEEISGATENFSQQRCIGARIATKEFNNELQMISQFSHENVISFIGYCNEGNERIIVYEYAVNGSLDHHLQDPKKMSSITWTQRLKICIGAARGLNYLHSGCGQNNRPNTQLHTKVAGTQFYLDPSYHESSILQKESDIYSFGVVLFEMLSGMLVYHTRSIGEDGPQHLINLVRRYYPKELHNLIDPNIRDQVDSYSFDAVKEIAYQCINLNIKERPKMELVIERIEAAMDIQENVPILMECVVEDIGFSNGIPVAAFTIYKCLLHWKCFQAERTNVFDRIIQIFLLEKEDHDNKKRMAYWLSNASNLLFLIHKSQIPDVQSKAQRQRPAISLFGRMTKGLHSPMSSVNLTEDKVVQQVGFKYPALLFKQQLTACVEKIYSIIRDNLKKELRSSLALCIQVPQLSKKVLSSGQTFGKDYPLNHWQEMVDCLNTLLHSLKENFVPSIIVQKIFAQAFKYINVQLFNSLLLCQEYCTSSNGEYVKAGLAKLELWCFEAKEENAGSAWDELVHTRQAIGFLVKQGKPKISYDELSKDLCPSDHTSHITHCGFKQMAYLQELEKPSYALYIDHGFINFAHFLPSEFGGLRIS